MVCAVCVPQMHSVGLARVATVFVAIPCAQEPVQHFVISTPQSAFQTWKACDVHLFAVYSVHGNLNLYAMCLYNVLCTPCRLSFRYVV
jgi:hypothetical protein